MATNMPTASTFLYNEAPFFQAKATLFLLTEQLSFPQQAPVLNKTCRQQICLISQTSSFEAGTSKSNKLPSRDEIFSLKKQGNAFGTLAGYE
jgi:hypothetical protein